MSLDDRAVGTRLKLLLDPPPPGLDSTRATEVARRAYRRRRRYTAAAVVLLLAAGSAFAVSFRRERTEEPPAARIDYDRCVVRQLAVPVPFQILAADPSGTYLAGLTDDGMALLHAGTVTRIPMPAGASRATPTDVDGNGTVVGGADSGIPWIYRNGATTRLPLPAGFESGAAADINADGDVVGVAERYLGTGTDRRTELRTGVVWRAGALDTPVTTAPGPDAGWTQASGIADDGTIVGSASDSGVPYTWRLDGSARRLDMPSGYGRGMPLGTRAGWVYGLVEDRSGQEKPARWNLKTGAVTVFEKVSGNYIAPADVNPDGVLAVSSTEEPGKAFVVDTAGAIHPLPNQPARLRAISDDGRTIIGEASFPEIRPALWTCD